MKTVDIARNPCLFVALKKASWRNILAMSLLVPLKGTHSQPRLVCSEQFKERQIYASDTYIRAKKHRK